MEADQEFASVAGKFYSTEAERQGKYRELAPELIPFYEAMKGIIEDLYLKDVRFCVFDMVPDIDPPRIHVGMTTCCREHRKKDVVTDDMRRDVAARIVGLTKFKDVRWEI